MVEVNGGMVPPLGWQDPQAAQGPGAHGVRSDESHSSGKKFGDLERNWPTLFRTSTQGYTVKSPYVSVVPDSAGPTGQPGAPNTVCSATIYVHLSLDTEGCSPEQVKAAKAQMEGGAMRLSGKCECPKEEPNGPGWTVKVVIVWHPTPKRPRKLEPPEPGAADVKPNCGGKGEGGHTSTLGGTMRFSSDISKPGNEGLCAHEIGHMLFGDDKWKNGHNPDPKGIMRDTEKKKEDGGGGGVTPDDRPTQEELCRLAEKAGIKGNKCCWREEPAKQHKDDDDNGDDDEILRPLQGSAPPILIPGLLQVHPAP